MAGMETPWWMRALAILRQVSAWGLLLLCLLFLALPGAGMLLGMVSPPAVPDLGIEPQRVGDRMVVGESYRERIGCIDHLHLVGDEIAIGYAHGALMGERIAEMETELLATFAELVPSFWLRHLVLGLVSFNNRDLVRHFTPAELRELAASGHPHERRTDIYRELSPGFSRAVQYHALHDASQYMVDNPLVNAPQVGCTALAVAAARSASGRVLVGRLLDFEGGDAFDRDKLVITCDPDDGYAFCSVVWPGMVGAVTGLNEAGIFASVNASVSDEQRFSGRPVVLVLRQILQHAGSIDEAVALVAGARLFVSSNLLIASGDEDRVVVVEVGPGGHHVRELADDHLVVTNHFEHPGWADDAASQRRREEGTSTQRAARAVELLDEHRRCDLGDLLTILRDRCPPGGAEVGFGNRGTINAWIGAHLVVADPAARLLYVAEPSHGLGRALAFGVAGPLDLRPLPADDELSWHARAGDRFASIIDQAYDMVERGELEQAAVAARHLLELNPNSFAANEIAGLASVDPVERRRRLERALALQPAYPADETRIRAALDVAGAAP